METSAEATLRIPSGEDTGTRDRRASCQRGLAVASTGSPGRDLLCRSRRLARNAVQAVKFQDEFEGRFRA